MRRHKKNLETFDGQEVSDSEKLDAELFQEEPKKEKVKTKKQNFDESDLNSHPKFDKFKQGVK